ncbi:MAG TPA: metallophosphoesterase family protein [Candidatus Ozemobacteraceae bacterium]|nr:metallophosphoesterase family protein [Candidatus Ozemobacteraceae bacterium]
MKLGIFSDVHANLQALQACLLEMARLGCHRLICLGDVATLGREPIATLRLLMNLECLFIRGNHDRYLLDPASIDQYDTVELVRRDVRNVASLLHDEDRVFLRSFVPHATLELAGTRLCFFHGSPISDEIMLLPHLPKEKLFESTSSVDADWYIGGHIHSTYTLDFKGKRLINAGSLGAPFVGWNPAKNEPLFGSDGSFLTIEAMGNNLSVTFHTVPLG